MIKVTGSINIAGSLLRLRGEYAGSTWGWGKEGREAVEMHYEQDALFTCMRLPKNKRVSIKNG